MAIKLIYTLFEGDILGLTAHLKHLMFDSVYSEMNLTAGDLFLWWVDAEIVDQWSLTEAWGFLVLS